MKKYLYDIYQTSSKNQCCDLTIALAMFLADARMGKQEYGPDGLDYEKLHQDYDKLMEEEKKLRLFMGRHNQKLAQAYRTGERALFEQAIQQAEAEELEQAKKAEQKDGE